MFRNKAAKNQSIKGQWPLILAFGIAGLITIGSVIYKPTISSEEITSKDKEDFFVDDLVYTGNIDAPVIVIEFADPLCPGCKSFFENTEPELKTLYIDKGLIKFYHWPMTFFETSIAPWEAMYCAAEQGKYQEYRHYLLSIPREAGTFAEHERNEYINFAKSIGLNIESFNDCFAGGKYYEWIKSKDQERLDRNITISPIVFVDGQMANSGGAEDVFSEIDRALIKKGF